MSRAAEIAKCVLLAVIAVLLAGIYRNTVPDRETPVKIEGRVSVRESEMDALSPARR